jgi:hypothetical protein
MTMFGLRNTLPITMDITPSHARAVARIKRAFIVARFTLIVLSSTGEAVTNAGEFMCAMCAAVKHAKELDDRFIQEYGCFVCREMRNKIFGRSFDLLDPKECEDFESGAISDRCPSIAGNVAMGVAEMLPNDREEVSTR